MAKTAKKTKPVRWETILQTILNRIQKLRELEKEHRVNKSLLFAEVYSFVEAYCSSTGEDESSALELLKDRTGYNKSKLSDWYRNGLLMREAGIDPSSARATTVCRLRDAAGTTGERMKKNHLKKAVQLINDGASHKEIRNYLFDRGYLKHSMPTKITSYQKEKIRNFHKSWEDWQADLNAWAEMIAATTDGDVHVRLALHINKGAEPLVEGVYFRRK